MLNGAKTVILKKGWGTPRARFRFRFQFPEILEFPEIPEIRKFWNFRNFRKSGNSGISGFPNRTEPPVSWHSRNYGLRRSRLHTRIAGGQPGST